jgi:hypothetical protein
MGLPRPKRTKYGISLREIAARTGWSESKVKRLSTKSPEVIAAMLQRQGTATADEQSALADRLEHYEDVIWRAHMRLCRISADDTDLRARLEPVLGLTRPVVEAL